MTNQAGEGRSEKERSLLCEKERRREEEKGEVEREGM